MLAIEGSIGFASNCEKWQESGIAVDKPVEAQGSTVNMIRDPDHVMQKLIQQLDRLDAFFGELRDDVHTPQPGANNATKVNDTAVVQGSGLDPNTRQFLLGARAVMENGLLGILKEHWGIEPIPIKPGEPFDRLTMLCERTEVPPDKELRGRIIRVTKSGYTYGGGKIYRLARVIIYSTQS